MQPFRRTLAATVPALGLALGGCTVGPDYRAPAAPSVARYTAAPLPAETAGAPVGAGSPQRFAAAARIPAEWWALYRSPALDGLIRKAIADNPTLDAAQASLRQAREDLNAEGGVLYPTVTADATALRQRTVLTQTGKPAPESFLFNLFNVSVGVSYTLDFFGAARRGLEALRAQVDYERFQLEASYLALTANVVTAAVRQARLRELIDVTKELIADEQKQADLVERQYRLGAVARADVLAQRSQLAQTRATLPPLELQLAQTDHELAALAGALPSEGGVPALDLAALHLPEEVPVSLPSELARQRPDIRAAEALLHEASAQVGVATANLYPRISLSGAYGTSAGRTSQLFGADNHAWNLGAALAQPLFDGGTLQARRRAAVAAWDQASAQYRAVVLQAFRNVADALRALEADARTLSAVADATAQARESLALAEAQFRAGAVSYLTLLNAQRQYRQARLALVDAQAARLADTAALFQALGGGWWNRGDGPVAARQAVRDALEKR